MKTLPFIALLLLVAAAYAQEAPPATGFNTAAQPAISYAYNESATQYTCSYVKGYFTDQALCRATCANYLGGNAVDECQVYHPPITASQVVNWIIACCLSSGVIAIILILIFIFKNDDHGSTRGHHIIDNLVSPTSTEFPQLMKPILWKEQVFPGWHNIGKSPIRGINLDGEEMEFFYFKLLGQGNEEEQKAMPSHLVLVDLWSLNQGVAHFRLFSMPEVLAKALKENEKLSRMVAALQLESRSTQQESLHHAHKTADLVHKMSPPQIVVTGKGGGSGKETSSTPPQESES